jgi:hypothetical protein
MKRSELKTIIRECIEEGKGDVSSKMRRRKAQKKYKRRELEMMKSKEVANIARDLDVMPLLSTDTDDVQDVNADTIDSILGATNA